MTAALALAGAAVCVWAQEPEPPPRSPQERTLLLRLSFELGQVHALRVLCRGEDDQTWRTRMTRMIDVEAASEADRRQLVARFNDGYLAVQGEHAECGTPARDAADRAAQAAAMTADTLASRR